MSFIKLSAGRNIILEKSSCGYRIHALDRKNGNHSPDTVPFFTSGNLELQKNDFISFEYSCFDDKGGNLFEAVRAPAVDPLFFDGSGNIAQVIEYDRKQKTGKARIAGYTVVPVKGNAKGRKYLLPDGNGSFIYSKRGGAKIIIPEKETDDGKFCTILLGSFYGAENLYTGEFTADFADTYADEYIIYNSSAQSLSMPAGKISWGTSTCTVPVLKKAADGNGLRIILNPETASAELATMASGTDYDFSVSIADARCAQLWTGGNIRMWWIL